MLSGIGGVLGGGEAHVDKRVAGVALNRVSGKVVLYFLVA